METECERRNAWLIAILAACSGQFCEDMREKLKTSPVKSLSAARQMALRRIYGERFGREGSAAYETAVRDFDRLTDWNSFDLWSDSEHTPLATRVFRPTPEQEAKLADLSKAFDQLDDSDTVCMLIDVFHGTLMSGIEKSRKAKAKEAKSD